MKTELKSVSALLKCDQPIGFKAVLNKQDFNEDIHFEAMISFLIKEQEKKYADTLRKEYLENAYKAIAFVAKGLKQESVEQKYLIEILLTAITELHILEKYKYIPSDLNNGVKYIFEGENYDPLNYDSSPWEQYMRAD